MINTLIVFLGAGVGGGFRHGVNVAVARLLPGLGFPLATLIINVLGSFLMGVLAEGFALRGAAGHPARATSPALDRFLPSRDCLSCL